MKAVLIAIAVGVMVVSGCASQAGYLLKQGADLLKYRSGARPVQSLIDDPTTPPQTREFLLRVQDITRFATREIGLKANRNYTRYRQIDRDHLVDVVQACDAVSFTPYEWSYPFLGRLPYRGYYDRSDARREAERLKQQGWDVIVRPVDAFSTLGFLRDPLYSFMQHWSLYELASTLIHEQTHATLFLRGQPDFNEEMASFVGDTGALIWLAQTYGEGSPQYRDAVAQQADADLFVSLLQGLASRLQAVYSSELPREEKLARKAQIIDAFKADLATDTRFHSSGYTRLESVTINNAFISLYRLYNADVPLLRTWYVQRCGSSLARFMQSMEELARHGNVKEQIRRALGG